MATTAVAKYVLGVSVKGMRRLGRLGNSLKGIAGSVLSLRGAMVLAGGVAGLGYLIKQSMNATDELGKMSSVVGVSVENLARLRHAASIGGMEATKLDKAVQKLAVNMADVAGGTGEARDEFLKYGIQATNVDGSMRDVVDVMADVADVTQHLGSTTERTDLIYKLFGARGAGMVNILKDGSGAMRELMNEADGLGLVMTTKMVRGVESANDSITRLSAFMTTSFHQAIANLAPVIQKITDNIREWFTAKAIEAGGVGELAKDMARAVINASKSMLLAIQEIGNGLINFVADMQEALPNFMGGVDKASRKLIDMSGATKVLDNALKGFNKSVAEAKDHVEDLNVTADKSTVWDKMREGFSKYAENAKKGTLSIKDITNKAMGSLENGITDMIMGVKGNFKSMIASLIKDLIKLQVRMALIGVMKSVFGLNVKGFANGGRPPVGRASIVGERGAELFVPDRAGTVIPNHQLNSVTGEVRNVSAEINFNVQAIDAASFNSYLVTNKSTIEQVINSSLVSNGSVRKTIKQVM